MCPDALIPILPSLPLAGRTSFIEKQAEPSPDGRFLATLSRFNCHTTLASTAWLRRGQEKIDTRKAIVRTRAADG
jgi:hypothetical protein